MTIIERKPLPGTIAIIQDHWKHSDKFFNFYAIDQEQLDTMLVFDRDTVAIFHVKPKKK